MRLKFGLGTVSAGLLDGKERCGMCKDGKCEICDEGVEEDVHFLLHCGEFAGDIRRLFGMIVGIGGTEEWMQNGETKVMKVEEFYCWVDQ